MTQGVEEVVVEEVVRSAHKPIRTDKSIVLPNWLRTGDSIGARSWHCTLEIQPNKIETPFELEDATDYSFVQTAANPFAVDELPKHQAEIDARYPPRVDIDFYFSTGLMNFYIAALHNLAERKGIEKVFSYPRVDITGICDLWHRAFVEWPVVHQMIDSRGGGWTYLDLIRQLNTDEVYDFLMQITPNESNHDKAFRDAITLLREKAVNPLVAVPVYDAPVYDANIYTFSRRGDEIKTYGQPFELYKLVKHETECNPLDD